MHEAALERAVDILLAARREGRPLAPLPKELCPGDEGEGYALQEALHNRLGTALGGWKIACTNPKMQAYLGVPNPGAGGVQAARVHQREATFRLAEFIRVGVENEVAVRMGEDMPADGAPFGRDDVSRRVAACMAAMEVVEDRYADHRAVGSPTLIADDFFQAAAVIGPPLTDWQDLDLAAVKAVTSIDGVAAATGLGSEVMGHPFDSLAWLANNLAARGRRLKRDDLVLTGSMTMVLWLDSPAAATVTVSGLGSATAVFEA